MCTAQTSAAVHTSVHSSSVHSSPNENVHGNHAHAADHPQGASVALLVTPKKRGDSRGGGGGGETPASPSNSTDVTVLQQRCSSLSSKVQHFQASLAQLMEENERLKRGGVGACPHSPDPLAEQVRFLF